MCASDSNTLVCASTNTITMVQRFTISITLMISMLVIFALAEFSMWNVEYFSALKSISDETSLILITIGMSLTCFVYLYVRKKGWWNVNSKYVEN